MDRDLLAARVTERDEAGDGAGRGGWRRDDVGLGRGSWRGGGHAGDVRGVLLLDLLSDRDAEVGEPDVCRECAPVALAKRFAETGGGGGIGPGQRFHVT